MAIDAIGFGRIVMVQVPFSGAYLEQEQCVLVLAFWIDWFVLAESESAGGTWQA